MRKILSKFTFITPLMFVGIGFATAAITLISKKVFDPFILMSWIVSGIAELFFRKQKIIPSNILSFLFGLIFMLFIKLYIVDINNMASHSMEPAIPMDSKVFLVKSFYSLNKGDIIAIHYPGIGNYIARIRNMPGDKITFQNGQEEILSNDQYYIAQDNTAVGEGMKLGIGIISQKDIIGKIYKFGP